MFAFKIVQNIETVAVSSSGISTSGPIPLKSGYLKISSDQNIFVEISPTPSLSTSSLWIASGETVVIKDTVISQKVVGIQTGATTNVILPEGTFSQFIAGDYVQLTGIQFAGINTNFSRVVSVDNEHTNNGGYSRRIEIDHNTSSVAYPSVWTPSVSNVDQTAELRRITKVGVKGDGQAANVHITEIQIAGG
jgi:hypothetical protein